MFDFTNTHKALVAHKEILCDEITPLSVLFALKAKVLLESAYNETGKDRYSIMILAEAFRICKEQGAHWLMYEGKKILLREALGAYMNDAALLQKLKITKGKKQNAEDYGFLESLAIVRTLAPQPQEVDSSDTNSPTYSNVSDLPLDLPLPLGGAGYIGYEFFAEIENLNFNNPAEYSIPECGFIFGRDFLVFDHLFDRLHIVSVGYAYEKEHINPKERVERIMHDLKNLPRLLQDFAQDTAQDSIKSNKSADFMPYTIIKATSQTEYESMVEDLKKCIYAGDLLQCVPSQSMQIHSSMPPLQAYRHLRHQNPSPYMFYYDFDDFVILGASPEIMIRLKSQNESSNFILRPIAGTRPRGKSVAEDKQLESQLLSDEKELSEHLMLLDLARNDAGKVSVGGGVEVVYRNKIERYSRVMHIVSQVQGELDSKRFAKRDAFKATFPAGTLSGAPKIEAIKNIERLESSARGIYGGAIGYFTYDEDMDFAIAIRSAVYQNGVYYVRSGAGVVQDSIPKSEFIETQNKVQSMLDMLAPKD
ncbi:anthranilate synthase component I family protein [Helicobacter typhlonius]|uniref:anthranilate synthase component I family protein n=1 Tax=Helicobacter typhlonius TaxID=76936 RepID=UPI002FDF8EB6